jgi:hypothetical protein
MIVQLPNGNGGLRADVGVLHCHGIRGSKLTLDAVVSGLLGVSSPPVSRSRSTLCREDQVREVLGGGEESPRVPGIRFIPFAVTEFGTLGGHAIDFFRELAK